MKHLQQIITFIFLASLFAVSILNSKHIQNIEEYVAEARCEKEGGIFYPGPNTQDDMVAELSVSNLNTDKSDWYATTTYLSWEEVCQNAEGVYKDNTCIVGGAHEGERVYTKNIKYGVWELLEWKRVNEDSF